MAARPVAIVLASRCGERFLANGGTGFKLQAMLDGPPLLEKALAAVRTSNLPWHVEDAGHPGMDNSVAAGVRATAHASAWLILPGDLPLIQASTLRQIAQAAVSLEMVVSVRQPARPSGAVFSRLRTWPPAPERARWRSSHRAGQRPSLWPVYDKGCVLNVDMREDLRWVEQLLWEM